MTLRHFAWRLGIACIALAVAAGFVIGLLEYRHASRRLAEVTDDDLRLEAAQLGELARGPLESNEPRAWERLQQQLKRLSALGGNRYTVLLPDGRVAADSHDSPASMTPQAYRPEVVQVSRGAAEGRSRRPSTRNGVVMDFIASPLQALDGQQLLGVVCVGRRADAPPAGQILVHLPAAAALGALAAWLLSAWLARRFGRPLQEMTAAAQAMAGGDDLRRVRLAGEHEIKSLGQALNTMADHLQERLAIVREERSKLEAILAGMLEGVVALDSKERILHVNLAAGRILNVEPFQVVGRSMFEVQALAPVCEMVARTILTGCETRGELTQPVGDRTAQVLVSPLLHEGGGKFGAVLVLHDVTELRRLEHVRRDFVANVSHELKTPLTAIKGLVDTMAEDPVMERDLQHRFLVKIQKQSDRLASLVTDLLVLGRIESVEVGGELQPLDVRQPVRESCGQLLGSAQQKGLRLQLSLPDEPVVARGENEALRQMVDNLLSNAIRYTPAGGQVSVVVERQNGMAVLSVRDTGIGIEPEHIDRIFERFYRVDKARSRELGGTGLGLAIVKHVTMMHGGTVSVQSEPGRGSVFTVRLPLTELRAGDRGVA
jgi:two-component system phosphate regulon sensor histidine kinase PhoR